jgi:hypothetical protein
LSGCQILYWKSYSSAISIQQCPVRGLHISIQTQLKKGEKFKELHSCEEKA